MLKTYMAKPKEIQRNWWLIDAENLVVGRLAVAIADLLRGKHKATFTPHLDCGDYVVVINADKVKFTGRKFNNKRYYWHTGYPGGIKERSPRDILEGRFPERVLEKAVFNMISRGPLQRDMLRKLHIYSGTEHKHNGQNPQIFDFASKNPKNVARNRS
jgi:large subunit ribosomal protein L13